MTYRLGGGRSILLSYGAGNTITVRVVSPTGFEPVTH